MTTVVQKYKAVTDVVASKSFTVTGYQPPVTIKWDEWVADGQRIRNLDVYGKFLLGDWINAGQQRFGEMYSQAIDQGVNYNTAIKCAWVARKIHAAARPLAFDRPFSHSELLAKQNFGADEQVDWLTLDVENNYTTMQLAEAISIATGKLATPVDAAPPPMEPISPPATEEEEVPFAYTNEVESEDAPVTLYGEAIDDTTLAEEAAYSLGASFCDLSYNPNAIGVELESIYDDFAQKGETCCAIVPIKPNASWWLLVRDYPLCILPSDTPMVVVGVGVSLQEFTAAYSELGDVYVRNITL